MSRDSQKSRLYDAERKSGLERKYGERTMSIADCQALVNKVLASPVVERRYPKRVASLRRDGIHVIASRNGGKASFGLWEDDDGRQRTGWTIGLGVWARQEFIVLHEVAHHLVGLRQHHGWQFCACLLFLTRRYLGAEAHAALEAAYKAGRIRYRAPRQGRTLTPEQREAAIARLAAARPASTNAAVATWRSDDATERHVCVTCGRTLPATKFPTTGKAGEREERCRVCRDTARRRDRK